ncbi:MAG: YHS domain-containing (seleno)protein [Flavobacteriales bacterium]
MKHALLAAFALLFFPAVQGQSKLKPFFNVNAQGLWVEGYDPVAYFVDRKAVKGNPEFSLTYKGATFHFATKTHQELFRLEAEKYLPQYGGYCAYAIGANNEKVTVDPGTFTTIDGKVFLFYNAFFNNTLTSWNKDATRLHRAADEHWAAFKHSE